MADRLAPVAYVYDPVTAQFLSRDAMVAKTRSPIVTHPTTAERYRSVWGLRWVLDKPRCAAL